MKRTPPMVMFQPWISLRTFSMHTLDEWPEQRRALMHEAIRLMAEGRIDLPEPTPLPRQRERANQRQAPISVYEVHAGSWRRGVSGEFPTWDELAEQFVRLIAAQRAFQRSRGIGINLVHTQLLNEGKTPSIGTPHDTTYPIT